MNQRKSKPKIKLDLEEEDILQSFEKGEWKSISAVGKEKNAPKRLQNALYPKTSALIFAYQALIFPTSN